MSDDNRPSTMTQERVSKAYAAFDVVMMVVILCTTYRQVRRDTRQIGRMQKEIILKRNISKILLIFAFLFYIIADVFDVGFGDFNGSGAGFYPIMLGDMCLCDALWSFFITGCGFIFGGSNKSIILSIGLVIVNFGLYIGFGVFSALHSNLDLYYTFTSVYLSAGFIIGIFILYEVQRTVFLKNRLAKSGLATPLPKIHQIILIFLFLLLLSLALLNSPIFSWAGMSKNKVYTIGIVGDFIYEFGAVVSILYFANSQRMIFIGI